MSSESLGTLSVDFAANIDSLSNAGGGFADILARMTSIADDAGAGISSGLETALNGFDELANAAGESESIIASSTSGSGASFDDLISTINDAVDSIVTAINNMATGFDDVQNAISDSASMIDDAISSMHNDVVDELDSLATNVSDASDEIASKFSSMSSSASESASSMSGSFSGVDFGGLLNQAGMAVFSLQNLWNTAGQVSGALLGPAMSAEQMQQSFTNLLGSTTAATNELSQLNDFAAKTQFKTMDVDEMSAKLIGFGVSAQTVIPDLTAVGDALTAVGKGSPDEMNSVVDILGKMSVQGKLTQGDITELGKHGIDAMHAIASGAGISTDQLMQMIKNGTLPANDAIADLTKGIEDNPIYEGGMAKQAGTLSGLMSTLSSDFGQFMATIMAPALPSLETGLTNLTNLLTSPSFKEFASNVGQGIVNAFSNIGTAMKPIVDAFAGLGSHVNLKDLQGALSTLAGILQGQAGNALKFFGGLITQIGTWVETSLLPAIAQAAPTFLNIAGVIQNLAQTALPPLIQGVEQVVPPVINLAQNIASDLTPGLQALQPVVQAVGGFFQNVLAPGIGDVVSGISNVVKWIPQAVSWFQKHQDAAAALLIPLGILAGVLVSLAVGGIASFIATVPGMVAGFLAGAASAWTMAAGVIAATWPFILAGLIIGAVVFGIVEAIKHWGAIVDWLKGAWGAISGFFGGIFGAIGGFFSGIGKWFQDRFTEAYNGVINAFGAVRKWFQDRFNDVVNIFVNIDKWFAQKFTDAWNAVTGAFGHIGQFLMGLWNAEVTGWEHIGEWFHDRFTDAWNAVTNIFGNIGKWFSDRGNDIKNAFSSAFGALGNIASGAWGTVKSAIKAGVNDAIGLINNLIHGINNISSKVGIPGIPDIPYLAAGGIVPPGGIAVAGETGKPELVFGGTSGATVIGVSQTAAMMAAANTNTGGTVSGGSAQPIQLMVYIGTELVANELVHPVMNKVMANIRSLGSPVSLSA